MVSEPKICFFLITFKFSRHCTKILSFQLSWTALLQSHPSKMKTNKTNPSQIHQNSSNNKNRRYETGSLSSTKEDTWRYIKCSAMYINKWKMPNRTSCTLWLGKMLSFCISAVQLPIVTMGSIQLAKAWPFRAAIISNGGVMGHVVHDDSICWSLLLKYIMEAVD